MTKVFRVWWDNRVNSATLIVSICVLFVSTDQALYPRPITAADAIRPRWHFDGLPGQTVHSLALAPTQPRLVVAGTDRGVFVRTASLAWHLTYSDATVWSVATEATGRIVVAGDEAGYVSVSSDAGRRWRRTLVTADGVYAVTIQPGAPRHLLAGAGGGIFRSTDGGRHWKRRLSLPQSGVAAFVWLPGSARVVFAGAVASGSAGSVDVFVSHNAGATWRIFGRGLGSGGGIMSLAVSARSFIYTGTMGHATWKADLKDPVWRQIAGGMNVVEDHVSSIVVLGGPVDVVFGATLGQGVFRTINGGRHWVSVSAGLPQSSGETIVLSLAYSTPIRTLYAGTVSGVYKLTTS